MRVNMNLPVAMLVLLREYGMTVTTTGTSKISDRFGNVSVETNSCSLIHKHDRFGFVKSIIMLI
jgi:hypothetical protein